MIVIDSSTVIDLLLSEHSDVIRARLTGTQLHAPHLLDHEFLNAVRGLVLGSRTSAHRAREALTDFDDLRIVRWAMTGPLRERVFGLRHNLTAYDASYVALAEVLDCPLVTRDARIARAVSGVRVEVL